MVPQGSEVEVHVLVQLLSAQVQVFADDFSAGSKGTLLINPELRGMLDLEIIVIAAATVTAAILRDLPKVSFLLSKAAVAIAAAINFNFEIGSLFPAECIAFADESVHEVVIRCLRIPLRDEILICGISFLDGDRDIPVLLLHEFIAPDILKHITSKLEQALITFKVLIELALSYD